ncbi:LOB domain-containing protein 36 [Linum perenne]
MGDYCSAAAAAVEDMSSLSSNSPCAACKFLRRKCTQECIFAPYFPPDQPQKFASVHKVFGASNVAKLLKELSAVQREDAVNSLAYEAEERLRDPVYGCVGLISILQHRLKQLHHDLELARRELANYIGAPHQQPVREFQNYPSYQQQPEGAAVRFNGGLGGNYDMNRNYNYEQIQNNSGGGGDQEAQVFFQTRQQLQGENRHFEYNQKMMRRRTAGSEAAAAAAAEEEDREFEVDRGLLMRPTC